MRETENRILRDVVSYADNSAHLSDELRRLDLILNIEFLRRRRTRPVTQNGPLRGLVLLQENMAPLLERLDNPFELHEPLTDDDPEIAQLREEMACLDESIRERRRASRETGVYLALPDLSVIFGLSRQEEQCLVACLATQLHPKYEKFYACLNDDITRKQACVGMILNLIGRSPADRLNLRQIFDPMAPLLRFGLLHFAESQVTDDPQTLLAKSVAMDDRIVNFLVGHNRADSRLDYVSKLIPAVPNPSEDWITSDLPARILGLAAAHFGSHQKERQSMVVYLYGRYGCGKSTLVRKVCADLGMPLLLADAAKIVHAQKTIAETIWLLGREAVLQQAVLCLDNFHRLIEEEGGTRFDAEQLFESFRTFMPLAFILGSGPWTPRPLPEGHIFIDLEIKPPEYWTRREIWKRYNDEYGLRLSESDMFELAAKFRLTQGQIREAIRAAGHHSLLTLPEEGRVTKEGIYRCCRAQSTPILIILARKMESPYSWDDIVLPAVSRAMLREICNHVKYHNVVYDDWGFRGKISLGRGLTVLFSGPSGTGKTMAAEVIANELGLELFRIDLSQIVSKYIGETEKNLNRIFEEAGDSNSILFFDEADALFGKRSEVRDSHDRYANIEIAYLLQKMEEYEGMTILATNLRKNIDEAFLRRMRFSIDFPVPDEKLSELIWRKIFPGSAPLSSDIDFPFLASRFKLTGGNIRNIALAASFYAAGEPSDIRMEHIIIAVQRELQKMGKLCVKGEFGKYYELVEKELRYE